MFVLEALVLTFMTTPLVTWLYPLHLRRRISAAGVFDNVADDEATVPTKREKAEEGKFKTRFTVVLDKLEHVPAMMALTQLVQPPIFPLGDCKKSSTREASTPQDGATTSQNISTEALRLIELSDRVSAVMRSSVSESLIRSDPLLSIFRMFGQLNGIRVSPSVAVVKFSDLVWSVTDHARNHESQMIFLPWLPPAHNVVPRDDHHTPPTPTQQPIVLLPTPPAMKSPLSQNPFDLLFRSSNFKSPTSSGVGPVDVSNSVAITHSQFVRGVFSQSTTDVALFVDQSTLESGSSIIGSGSGEGAYQQHVFLPFFGGPDDRLALEFVVQICANPRIRGTVVRITKTDVVEGDNNTGLGGTPSNPAATLLGQGNLRPKAVEELNALTVGSVSVRTIS